AATCDHVPGGMRGASGVGTFARPSRRSQPATSAKHINQRATTGRSYRQRDRYGQLVHLQHGSSQSSGKSSQSKLTWPPHDAGGELQTNPLQAELPVPTGSPPDACPTKQPWATQGQQTSRSGEPLMLPSSRPYMPLGQV